MFFIAKPDGARFSGGFTKFCVLHFSDDFTCFQNVRNTWFACFNPSCFLLKYVVIYVLNESATNFVAYTLFDSCKYIFFLGSVWFYWNSGFFVLNESTTQFLFLTHFLLLQTDDFFVVVVFDFCWNYLCESICSKTTVV